MNAIKVGTHCMCTHTVCTRPPSEHCNPSDNMLRRKLLELKNLTQNTRCNSNKLGVINYAQSTRVGRPGNTHFNTSVSMQVSPQGGIVVL